MTFVLNCKMNETPSKSKILVHGIIYIQGFRLSFQKRGNQSIHLNAVAVFNKWMFIRIFKFVFI